MSDGSDEKGPSSKPGAGAEPDAQQRRRVRARQPTLLGVAAPSLAATIASVAKDASAPVPKPAAAPAKPPSGLGRPAAPKPAAALGRTLHGASTPSLQRDPAKSPPSRLGLAATVAAPKPKAELPKPAQSAAPSAQAPKALPRKAAAPAAAPLKPEPPAPIVEAPVLAEEIADLEASPTHVGASPEKTLAPALTGFAGPVLESVPFGALDEVNDEVDPLAGESTHVGAQPPQPSFEVAAELPFEATMPAARLPEPPEPEPLPEVEEPVRATPPPKELAVEPTVVVHPSLTSASKPETYRLDVRSGVVELAEDPSEQPPQKKSGMVVVLAVLGVVAALLVVGIGITAVLLLSPGDPEPLESAATGPSLVESAEPVEPNEEVAPIETVEAVVAPAQGEAEPADATEADAVEDEQAESSDEGPEPIAGAVVPRAEIDAYDLEHPRLSRRARRMPEAERRRQALRFRNAALRLYRERAYAESEASFRQGLEHLPRDGAACEGIARAIAQQSRFPEALAWARLAIERSPRSGAAYRVLGDIWSQAGHPDEAARAYRRGLARDPADRWLRRRLRELD